MPQQALVLFTLKETDVGQQWANPKKAPVFAGQHTSPDRHICEQSYLTFIRQLEILQSVVRPQFFLPSRDFATTTEAPAGNATFGRG
ncbi:MAG: hypothetical protein KDB23_25860 [Planctomycetales bacterium]|nr:hypothetical protein [Planctomycetales bacterium]